MTELTKLIFTGACQSWGLLTRKVIECCKSGLMGHSSKNLQKSSAQSSAMEVQNSRCLTGEKYLEQGKSLFSSHFGRAGACFPLHAKNIPEAKLESNRLIFLAEQILRTLNSHSVMWQLVTTAIQVYNVKE